MSGIIGATNKDWNFESAIKALRHRGTDSQQIIHNPDFSLGFTRLALIDLSRAADQPMSVLDGKVWIVFDGKIYAYKTLRDQLISKGYQFKTESDTEVVLNAYLQWGDDFVDHIDGMFAIAIHDLRTRQLKLFRDRPGIKPLYYYYDRKNFAFASELKGITALCSDGSFLPDTTALYDYLTYSYIPEPKTFYKNVSRLLPASELIFDLKEKRILNIRKYWRLNPTIHRDPSLKRIEEYSTELRQLIHESVKDQLVADVPAGCFLSGGLDSSIIVAEASALKPDLETFTIGFENKNYSESHFAESVAKNFRTQHHSKILTDVKPDQLFKALKTWYDEPFADTAAFPSFVIAQYARQKTAIVLTGDGADEVFGGYARYKQAKRILEWPRPFQHKLTARLSTWRKKFEQGSLLYKFLYGLDLVTCDEVTCYAMLMGGMTDVDKKIYFKKWQIPKDYDTHWYYRLHYREDFPILTRLQYLDFHTYLPSNILTKIDRVTMAVSLEARIPFLSRKIIEFTFSCPLNILYDQEKLKGLLRKAYQDILPPQILLRERMSCGLPPQYLGRQNFWIQEKILKEAFKIS